MQGKHGVRKCNESGEKLLEFYNLIIMNTWFTKKPIHQMTWNHLVTKQSNEERATSVCTDSYKGSKVCLLLDRPLTL